MIKGIHHVRPERFIQEAEFKNSLQTIEDKIKMFKTMEGITDYERERALDNLEMARRNIIDRFTRSV